MALEERHCAHACNVDITSFHRTTFRHPATARNTSRARPPPSRAERQPLHDDRWQVQFVQLDPGGQPIGAEGVGHRGIVRRPPMKSALLKCIGARRSPCRRRWRACSSPHTDIIVKGGRAGSVRAIGSISARARADSYSMRWLSRAIRPTAAGVSPLIERHAEIDTESGRTIIDDEWRA